MLWGEKIRTEGLATALDATQRARILAALNSASRYYRSIGLPAPKLPLDSNGAFNIFFLEMSSNTNGGTGPAVGVSDGVGTGAAVPAGTHLMMSGPNLLNPDYPEQGWVTLAHELEHAVDGSIAAVQTWPSEESRTIKWLGEGSTHAIAPFALKLLGFNPVEAWRSGNWEFGKEVGRRPYDVSLPLKPVPVKRPDWVMAHRPLSEINANYGLFELALNLPKKTEQDAAKDFWAENATYLTCGFFRFLFKEEAPFKLAAKPTPLKTQAVQVPFLPGMPGNGGPAQTRPGDFELFAAFRNTAVTDGDRAKAKSNEKWIDEGVLMLDRFLRTRHPTWGATGLYRAFPAFIAHFVEWPDQIGETRNGFFAHERWLESLFMDGVPKREISIGQDIEIELKPIAPLSARAVRFALPPLPDALTAKYPLVTITIVALDGPSDAIDNIHLGLRGNVLANSLSFPSRVGRAKVRRWFNIDARPLKRKATRGESVLTIINSWRDPARGRPLRVKVHIALQVGEAGGLCSYHPLPTTGPNGAVITLPSSVSPPAGKILPQQPTTRSAGEVQITIMQDADFVLLTEQAGTLNTSAIAVQRKTDEPPKDNSAELAKAMQNLQSMARPSKKSGLMVTLTMPRVEAGTTGPVSSGRVSAEWVDPVYNSYAKYGVSPSVVLNTDAVQINVTSSTEGTIVGRFVADFDKGSQNSEREFRGKIEGDFSVGIISDDEQGEGDLPEDPTSLLPTDWFIAAARAGIDTATMGQMMLDAISASGDGAGSASPVGGAGTDGGSSRLVGDESVTCDFQSEGEMRMALDRYLKQFRDSVPGITPEQLRTLREAMLASPETTAGILCEAGV